MATIKELEDEIKEYENLLTEPSVPADEKQAAKEEIADLKKQLAEAEKEDIANAAKEAAKAHAEAEKKKKVRKQVITPTGTSGAKTKLIKKKASGQVRSPEKKSGKKKANMVSFGKDIKKFNKGRSASDIIKDKQRVALSPGKRTSVNGNVYYEKRSNRADVSKKDRLEHGGGLYAKGGKIGDINSLIGRDVYKNTGARGSYEIVGIEKHSSDNIKVAMKMGGLTITESYTKKELSDLQKGHTVRGIELLKKVAKGGSLYKKGGKVNQFSKFGKVMKEFKKGTLKSSSGEPVTEKKQAIAIAFAESGRDKMKNGGATKTSSNGGSTIKLISTRAKEIWKGTGKEKWTDAIKRASNELKSEGKI